MRLPQRAADQLLLNSCNSIQRVLVNASKPVDGAANNNGRLPFASQSSFASRRPVSLCLNVSLDSSWS